jgi:hypothetical protein
VYQKWYTMGMDNSGTIGRPGDVLAGGKVISLNDYKQRLRLQVFLARNALRSAELELERAIAEASTGGVSVREMAQDLGVPAATAQRRIARAVESWEPHRSPGVGR